MKSILPKMSSIFKRTMPLLAFGLALMLFISSCSKVDVVEPIASKNPASVVASHNTEKAGMVNGVMMQGFYWNVPSTTPAGDWWQNLGAKATELAQAGITAIWLPPAYKGGSQWDCGYGVYDRYDLGEFNQKGTVATLYGTLNHLTSAIASLHGAGIQVYEDIVMNHLMNADYSEVVNGNTVWTGFNFPGRGTTYSAFQWNHTLMNGWQGGGGVWYQWNAWDFNAYNNGDAYDNLMGCEIRYNNCPAVVTETIGWGNWITAKLNLDGYRLDAVKHIYTPFLNNWLDNVKGSKFAVGECWFNSVQELNDYAAATGGRTSLFDVPLHYTFKAMSDGNGAWDMRGLEFAGFTEANGALSVSFVDNHDTDTPGGLYSPVVNLKMLAYAYILTREKGYPCVFYKDYYEYGLGSYIKTLIGIRQAHAYGSAYEYTSIDDPDLYVYSRSGDATHSGLLLMLNDGGSTRSAGTVTTDVNGYGVFSVNSRSYSVWVPAVPTPTTNVTFNVNYSGTVSGQDVYIVGSTAQLGSWNTANAIKLSGSAWPNWSTTITLNSNVPVQYKYFRRTGTDASTILWETTSANKNLTPTGASQSVTDTW
jgi:alpha-amylase